MSSRALSGIFVTALLVVALGGFVVGQQLGEAASEPGTQTLVLDRPGATAPRDVALRSTAGFTGFEEGALGGAVMRSGVTEDSEAGAFAVRTDSARMQVRTSAPARLFRLEPAGAPLAPGDIVVVRLGEDGAAEAVLRVPTDLREGDSR